MSDGMLLGTDGGAPPNMMFSPVASRWLLMIWYGPGPFQPQIACASYHALLKSDIQELVMFVSREFRATPRMPPTTGSACMYERSISSEYGTWPAVVSPEPNAMRLVV